MNKLLTTITILSLFLALEFSAGVSGEESSTTSVDQLDWLTGQREGSHDGGILEQTWLPPRSGTITALVRSIKRIRHKIC